MAVVRAGSTSAWHLLSLQTNVFNARFMALLSFKHPGRPVGQGTRGGSAPFALLSLAGHLEQVFTM